MKTFKTILATTMFCATISLCGCGEEPGAAHMNDPTPGGTPTPEISTNPDEVSGTMGADYGKQQSKPGK